MEQLTAWQRSRLPNAWNPSELEDSRVDELFAISEAIIDAADLASGCIFFEPVEAAAVLTPLDLAKALRRAAEVLEAFTEAGPHASDTMT